MPRLINRINAELSLEGQRLRQAVPGSLMHQRCGRFYVERIESGRIVRRDVHPERLAAELGLFEEPAGL